MKPNNRRGGMTDPQQPNYRDQLAEAMRDTVARKPGPKGRLHDLSERALDAFIEKNRPKGNDDDRR